MVQHPHFVATTTAADITSGITAGCYLAQVSRDRRAADVHVLYATSATAPIEDDDFFEAQPGESFVFRAGSTATPTWVKRTNPHEQPEAAFDLSIALARTGS